MMRTRDALSEFLEALAQPQNYDMIWDAAKGELYVRPLAHRPTPEAPHARRQKDEPTAAHSPA
jgi:hypothetical protein